MIENPIYGGAYACGKTCVASGYGASGVTVKIRRKVRSEWLALLPNAHEGYVTEQREPASDDEPLPPRFPSTNHTGTLIPLLPWHRSPMLSFLWR